MEINQKLFLSLTSLGYTETQVRNALEISNNNITEARQHLFTNVFLNNQDKNTLQYLNEIEKDIINDEEPNNEIPDFIDSKELIKFVAGFAFCRLKFLRQSIKVITHLIQKQELFLEFNDSDDFIKAFVQSVNQYLHNDTTNIYSPYFSSYPPLDHSFYDNLINDSLDVPKYKGYNITFIGEEKKHSIKINEIVILFEAKNTIAKLRNLTNCQRAMISISPDQAIREKVNKILKLTPDLLGNYLYLYCNVCEEVLYYTPQKIIPLFVKLYRITSIYQPHSFYLSFIMNYSETLLYESIIHQNVTFYRILASPKNVEKALKKYDGLANIMKECKWIKSHDIPEKYQSSEFHDVMLDKHNVYIEFSKNTINYDRKKIISIYIGNEMHSQFTLQQILDFVKQLPSFLKLKQKHTESGIQILILNEEDKIFELVSEDCYLSFSIYICSECACVRSYFNIEMKKHVLTTNSSQDNIEFVNKILGKEFYSSFKNNALDKTLYYEYINDVNPHRNSNDIAYLFDLIPGFVKYHSISDEMPIKFNNSNIQWLLYLHPEVKLFIENAQAIELDATFPLDDYIAIYPHIIYGNMGFLLGVFIGPSESAKSYQLIYDTLKTIVDESIIKKIPFINDFGKGLESFTSFNHLIVYYCLRHYLNRLGAGTWICAIASTIVFAWNIKEYDYKYELFLPIVEIYKNSGAINSAQYEAFLELKTQKKNLALCLRKPRISCSNHVESFHSHNNAVMSRVKSYAGKMNETLNYIIARANQLRKPENECALKLFRKNKKKNGSMKEENRCKTMICQKCQDKMKIWEEKYLTTIPCQHCAHLYTMISPPPALKFHKIKKGGKSEIVKLKIQKWPTRQKKRILPHFQKWMI